MSRAAAFALAVAIPAALSAQQKADTASSLVFDGVTVVDVESGKLLRKQRVVIVGNRIQTMGGVDSVKMPHGSRVVRAAGKYLIPGLWDMHVHTTADLPYSLLIANGVTGIRDAWSYVPIDTMIQWRREILAGTRVGPPRQLLTGSFQSLAQLSEAAIVARIAQGANFIKVYPFNFRAAAVARHVGVPFGGHVEGGVSAIQASDSGISIIDHLNTSGGMDFICMGRKGSVEACQPTAQRLRHNGTWLVPTLVAFADMAGGQYLTRRSKLIFEHFTTRAEEFWDGAHLKRYWPFDSAYIDTSKFSDPDSLKALHIMQRVDMPILAGTDMDVGPDHMWGAPPGFALHVELALYVTEGLTPLNALQSATLNPAKLLHATDSLGSVASGKLADLVLLDANPLTNITNTTLIRAVVANGRYFDRSALDHLLADVQTKAKQGFAYWWVGSEKNTMKTGDSP